MARKPSTTRSGGSFDAATIEAVWQKAVIDPGFTIFRKDSCGASIQRDKYGDRTSPFGWEIDHDFPVALGGSDTLNNLHPLQWENNVHKSDNWPSWTCKVRA
jgi:hypothetical protein